MTDETRTVGVFAGRHVLAELGGVDPLLLDDVGFLRSVLRDALTEAGATVCGMLDHRFAPQGVTVLAMLAESHASIHTYPELGAVFIDVFTCGDRADPERGVRLFAAALGTEPLELSTVRRGHAPAEGVS
jgi:S-adenosylmethionine decarboxylase